MSNDGQNWTVKLVHPLWGTVYIVDMCPCPDPSHNHWWPVTTRHFQEATLYSQDDAHAIAREAQRFHCNASVIPVPD